MFGSSPQPMPSDSLSAFMLAGLWPDPAAIGSFIAMAEHYQAARVTRIARLDELEQAASTIRATMVSDDFESMHTRINRVCQDQEIVVDNAATIAKWAQMFADECCAAQRSLVDAIEPYREKAAKHLAAIEQLEARVEMERGREKAKETQAEYLATIRSWSARAQAEMQVVQPWTPRADSSATSTTTHPSAPSIQPTDFKLSGGDAANGDGRLSETGERPEDNSIDAGRRPDDPKEGKATDREAEKAQTSSGHMPDNSSRPGNSENDSSSSNSSAHLPTDINKPGGGSPTGPGSVHVPASGVGSGAGGLPSSGGGLPSSGGGLPAAGGGLSSSGLGGVKAPSAEGVGVGSQSGLGSAGSGLGSSAGGAGSAASAARAGSLGSGGVAGSGGDVGGGRVGGGVASPLSGVPPVSSVSPVGGRADAGGGGFMPPAGAAPVQHSPAAGGSAVVGGGLPAAGSVMGAGPAAALPPAASAVGAAPTPSPGLSQGSLGPGGAPAAAAAGGGGAAAAGLGVVPSAFSGDAPEKIDLYGQMAADAVRKLAPAMAIVPGMLVAAAVVVEPEGAPQVVITTNDGAGFLPPGCFLPPNMIHAFADLDSKAFDDKWFGWVDPARTLLDYAYERAQLLGGDVQLLGLASTGKLSAEVKSAFKQAIPQVTPEVGAKPVEENRGRNAHRFKVLAPDFYDALMKADAETREQAMWLAAERAMATPAAAPLRAVGAPWHTMSQVRRPLTESEWDEFREQYDNAIRMCGVTRPGFLADTVPGAASGYWERFALVRAMEVLMCWRAPEVSAPDVVYSAHQAGADVNGILSPPSKGSRR